MLPARLRPVMKQIDDLTPLLRLSEGYTDPMELRHMPINPGGAPVTIQKVWFGVADDDEKPHIGLHFPYPGVQFTSLGGTIRLNTLESTGALDRVLNELEETIGYLKVSGHSKLMVKGEVQLDPNYIKVTVADSTDNEWGTYIRDLQTRYVIDSNTGELVLVLWEGWGGGNSVVITNPMTFYEKFSQACKEITKQIRDWKAE